ncbi:carbohydrate porin [Telmatocola sphagniphila]|uniref:Carbohydrate porin n=1 Tax=Telmatocola sphagniphila TaxID=1123043 RepID=A0A8E6B281_9BACT|nr:carbohydrate porin [Telmatocola sphagniphila]QVL30750.1 carbohydrate porin [Telmatocola sphagniphila]
MIPLRKLTLAGITGLSASLSYGQEPKATNSVLNPTPIEVLTQGDAAPKPALQSCLDSDPKAKEEVSPFMSTLTGNWGGYRDSLAQNGFIFRGDLTQFYQGVASGGKTNQFEYGGKLNYYVDIDGQKAGLWEGLFINMHAETRYGEDVNKASGALLPVNLASKFPGDGNLTAITSLKVTQGLSENLAVYAGKINTLDEDKLTFGGGIGIDNFMSGGLTFNATALRAVPYSTFGTGVVFLVDHQPAAAISVFDAVDHATDSAVNNLFSKGAVIVAEGGLPLPFEKPGSVSIGGVYSTRTYTSLDFDSYLLFPQLNRAIPVLGRETGSWSVFYKASQTLWTSCEDPKNAWGIFSEGGVADGNPSPLNNFFNFGISGSNPYATKDTFGLGYFYLGLSGPIKGTLALAGLNVRDEQGFELFYNCAVTPWFHLTPDVQLVLPTQSKQEAACVIGLRAKLDF